MHDSRISNFFTIILVLWSYMKWKNWMVKIIFLIKCEVKHALAEINHKNRKIKIIYQIKIVKYITGTPAVMKHCISLYFVILGHEFVILTGSLEILAALLHFHFESRSFVSMISIAQDYLVWYHSIAISFPSSYLWICPSSNIYSILYFLYYEVIFCFLASLSIKESPETHVGIDNNSAFFFWKFGYHSIWFSQVS
jgi:hypothetical protein